MCNFNTLQLSTIKNSQKILTFAILLEKTENER